MHGDESETAEAKRIIELEERLECGDAHCFIIMAQPGDGTKTKRAAAPARREALVARKRQATTEGWLDDAKATSLALCLAEDCDKDYANPDFLATHCEATSRPESELAWPAGLGVDDSKLFVVDKMPIPEPGMDQVVQQWHDRQFLHPGLENMHLDMKRRFEVPPAFCNTLNPVCESCPVCQVLETLNKSQAGNDDGTPVRHGKRCTTVSSSAFTATVGTSWRQRRLPAT